MESSLNYGVVTETIQRELAMRFALILSLLLAILAVVFALQNPASIDVNLGPFELYGSTALILMVTFCLGVVVGILATIPSLMKRRRRVRDLEKHAAETGTAWSPPESDIHTSPSKEYRTE